MNGMNNMFELNSKIEKVPEKIILLTITLYFYYLPIRLFHSFNNTHMEKLQEQ